VTADAASDFADFDGYGADVSQIADELPAEDEAEGAEAAVDAEGAQAPRTGNEQVDAATAQLEELAEKPTADHADVFEDVHRRLQGALADLDGS
jgi:hypothetical protein